MIQKGDKMSTVIKPIEMASLILFVSVIMCSCGSPTKATRPADSSSVAVKMAKESDDGGGAIPVVARAIDPSNKLGVKASDLKVMKNPKGDGYLVYNPERVINGTERPQVWVVIDGQACATNSPTKLITPNLPWPRDVNPDMWARTGLDMYSASDKIAIVFGD